MNSFEAGMAAGAAMMWVAWIVSDVLARMTKSYRKERQRLNELRELGRELDEMTVENIRREADKVSKLLDANPIKSK